jgi:transketolase
MSKATRAAYGETLVELVKRGYDLVVVDADLAAATTTMKLHDFDPDRFYNSGIAEQNMIGVAAGLSLAGKIAFTASFAAFGAGRAYEQIRNTVCISNLNVKIAPTHSGVTVGPDGGTHQMLEDISLMRGLPNMRVLVPADYMSAKRAIEIAADTPGPFYVRLGRAPLPEIYREDDSFEIGRAKVLREGADVAIVACGAEVNQALIAADALAADGINAQAIDAFSIKPLDEQAIIAAAEKCGKVITAEEHSIYGGLGSAVAELLSEHSPRPLRRIGVNDQFGQSGEADELLEHYGLNATAIKKAAKELIG